MVNVAEPPSWRKPSCVSLRTGYDPHEIPSPDLSRLVRDEDGTRPGEAREREARKRNGNGTADRRKTGASDGALSPGPARWKSTLGREGDTSPKGLHTKNRA